MKQALAKFAISAALGVVGWYSLGVWLDYTTSYWLFNFNDVAEVGFGIAVFVGVRLLLIPAKCPRTLLVTGILGAFVLYLPVVVALVDRELSQRRYEAFREELRPTETKLAAVVSIEDCATVVRDAGGSSEVRFTLVHEWIRCIERTMTSERDYEVCRAAVVDSLAPGGIEAACLDAWMGYRADHARSIDECEHLHAGIEVDEHLVTDATLGFWIRCIHNVGPHDAESRAACALQRPPGVPVDEVETWCAGLEAAGPPEGSRRR